MKLYKKTVFFLLISLTLSFCASTEKIQTQFPQEIASVYFQKWVGGRQESGKGIHFYLEFKEPLMKEIQLEKIYFQGQEAKVKKESDSNFVADFIQKAKDSDSDLEENKNEIPLSKKSKFDLKSNEAILEYKKNQKTIFFKIENIKEKPMIAYPSINKPKN